MTSVARLRARFLLGPLLAAVTSFGWAAVKDNVPVVHGAAPAFTTISGNPLTVNVGEDLSFQVFNSAIPGQGQMYPPDALETADMGWMVHRNGLLNGPDFPSHPGGSATASLGLDAPFSNTTVSALGGSGTSLDPYQVTTTATIADSALQLTQTVEYVNGRNWFTKRLSIRNDGPNSESVRVFVGGDIYLADSDSGVPFRESSSGSPGGQDCAMPATYTILYIPQVQPDAWTGNNYSNVWSQIGGGQLDNALSVGCQDNGAALQWNRTIPAGQAVSLQAATSFGEITDIAQFNVSAVFPASGAAGASVPVTISGFGFLAETTFNFGAGITVSDLVIVDGDTATATLLIDAGAVPGPRDVTGTQTPGGLVSTLVAGFTVTGGQPPPPAGVATPVPSLGDFGQYLLLLLVALMGLRFASRG